jgi:hypothetical protein
MSCLIQWTGIYRGNKVMSSMESDVIELIYCYKVLKRIHFVLDIIYYM